MRILLFIFWMLALLSSSKKGSLIVDVKNIENTGGVLHIAIYDKSNFLQEGKELIKTTEPVQTKQNVRIAIPDLPFGTYAIAIYHDVNNNGKLDKNYLGIPAEPYAFSNNPKAKWRSPTFEEAQIELNAAQKDFQLELKRWKNH